MHTDHSRVAAGESTQSQFSELIRNMIGSGPSALTNVNFEIPEFKVDLQQQEEMKEQVHSLEDEQLQQEVEEEDQERPEQRVIESDRDQRHIGERRNDEAHDGLHIKVPVDRLPDRRQNLRRMRAIGLVAEDHIQLARHHRRRRK